MKSQSGLVEGERLAAKIAAMVVEPAERHTRGAAAGMDRVVRDELLRLLQQVRNPPVGPARARRDVPHQVVPQRFEQTDRKLPPATGKKVALDGCGGKKPAGDREARSPQRSRNGLWLTVGWPAGCRRRGSR